MLAGWALPLRAQRACLADSSAPRVALIPIAQAIDNPESSTLAAQLESLIWRTVCARKGFTLLSDIPAERPRTRYGSMTVRSIIMGTAGASDKAGLVALWITDVETSQVLFADTLRVSLRQSIDQSLVQFAARFVDSVGARLASRSAH